jgi:import inner membrane translocase subunit TIM54
VLVAAAVDYELVPTGQYGSLTRLLHDKILSRRRQALGLESAPPTLASGLPGQLTPEQKLEREVDGGVVLIGRHTLKEYMEGLKRGWMGPVNKLDREGDVAKELEFDGVFEEKPAPTEDGVSEHQSEPPAAPAPATPSPPKMLGAFAHLQKPTPAISSTSPSESTVDPESLITPEMHQPPSPLPQQPAMLLVPWINHLGFKQIPYMFIGLFTESKKYREGGEAALKLILGPQRDFVGSEYVDHALALPSETATGADSSRSTTDLDFDLVEETWYKKAFDETPASIEKHRKEYYEHHLKPKLQAARELAAGTREPTKEEVAKPPPSEAELKAERLKKEFLWWKQLEGYEIVKRGSRVPWDERWTGWLKVFETPETSDRLEAVSNEDL